MSDVVVSVTESTTAVTVTEQDVAVAVTETSVDVSSSTAGVQGATGATGAQGASGVISVTSPVTNSGSASSAVLGLDQTALSLTRSQITDFTSGTVTSASTAQQSGTAVFASFSGVATSATSASTATNAGTATFATTSGTAVFATNASTAVTISGSIAQSQVTSLVTDLAGKASLGAANAFTVGGHVITNAATAVVPLVVKGAASQSADLFQIQSSAAVLSGFGNTGNLKVRTTTEFSAALNVAAASSTQIGAVIRGAASQTANLQEWQDSAGTRLISVNPAGSLLFSGSGSLLSGTNGRGLFITNDAAIIPMTIRGASSQSANLQEWQNSAGTILAKIGSDGTFEHTSTSSQIVKSSFFRAITDSVTSIYLAGSQNIQLFSGSASLGGGVKVMGIANATTVPSSNPTGGGILYVDAGALKYRGTSGSNATIVNADGTLTATDATVATASTGVGYMGLPQNTTTTGAYTIVAADAGEHIYASATRTVTIPANSALALPIGTTLTFIAGAGATMTIAITTDTMYLAGAGTTGSRTLAAHGIATAVKTTSTTWIISGNGLT